MTNSSESLLGRRAFFGIAAGTAASVAVPEIVRAATSSASSTLAPAGIAARGAGPAPADWTALARDLAGTLVRPGESGYATAKLLFDPRFDGQRPAGIAFVKNANDVSTCLAFVRKFKIPFAARSGGHSYAGWSGSSGLIIDVSDLKTIAVSGTTATVGAGIRLIDFYHGLAAKGRAVPGGSCPTVGIAGLTLGGGIGVTARAHGLTCDSLESLQIVTANGAVLTANSQPAHFGDLFWACQGGGGGNFGVVRTPTIQVGGTYLGSVGGAANLLGQLYARAGSHPATSFLSNPQPFLNAMLVEADCSSIGYQACHLPWYASGGKLTRQPQFTKSDFFTTALSSAGISTLLAQIAALQRVRGAAGGTGGIAFDALGGAVNRVAPDATAFVHRNALFSAQYTTDWTNGASSTGISNQHTWLRNFWTSMRRYASGQAYQNYIDPELTNWQQAYYGSNYHRLQTIKKKYDPTGLFTFPQAIQPAPAVLVTG